MHKQLKIKLTVEQHKRFHLLCVKHGTTMNAVMREGIERLLESPDSDPELDLTLSKEEVVEDHAMRRHNELVGLILSNPQESHTPLELWLGFTREGASFADVPSHPIPDAITSTQEEI